ncbi:hypothetical protein [Parasphingorhabdus sp.]|uniref:hypothetical protein n=1 Tax=Parasphingorhabdus sp. TaxID=2709688 RepID=UPI003D2ABC14
MISSIICAVVLTIVLLGFGLFQHANYHNDASRNAAHYSENAKDNIAIKCLDLTGQARSDCANEIEDAARANERDEYDLYSQKAMALWTAIMGGMAVVGVSLSGVGVYLIWQTFGQSQTAAKAAQDTHHSYIANERAVFRPIEEADISDAPNRPHMLRFEAKVDNRGRGNGIIKKIAIIASDNGEWPQDFPNEIKTSHFVKTGSRGKPPAIDFKPPEGTEIFFILGYIEYETLVDLRYESYFCYWIHPMPSEIISPHSHTARMRKFPSCPEDT